MLSGRGQSWLWLAALTLLIGSAAGCRAESSATEEETGGESAAAEAAADGAPALAQPEKSAKATARDREIAVIRVADLGEIRLRFFPDKAPLHVRNFKRLAQSGFYDGTTFHRVIPGFMIQGGDPNTKDDDPLNDGYGDSGRRLPAEFNDTPHVRGVLSMARGSNPNSASSQFFITVADAFHLDRQYTAFGEVISGMEVADKIVAVETGEADRPLRDVVVESVTILPGAEAPPAAEVPASEASP